MIDYRELLLPHLAAISRFRWHGLCVAWLVCLVGWLALAAIPDRYVAKARIYIDTETILGPLMKGLAVSPDFDHQVEMMRRTLLSVPNIQELIRMTDLDHTVHSDLERVELIEVLSRSIRVRTEGASLFEVSYQNEDPRLAQRVVDSILQIFVEQNLGHSQQDVEDAREFIDKQIVDYEEKLREAELEVALFQKENADKLGGADRNLRILEQREAELRRLNTEIESAIWRRDQLKGQLGSTPKTISVSSSSANGGGKASATQLRLLSLNEEVEAKLLVYTDKHPEVVALRALIRQAEERLARQLAAGEEGYGARIANPLHGQLREELQLVDATIQDLKRRLKLAENEIGSLSQTVASAPEVEADLTRLTRDYSVMLAQYEQLIQRRESADLAKDLDSDISRIEYRIIDPPTVPLKPDGPPRALFMAIILLIGFGCGLLFTVARQLLSGSFLTVDQLKSAFDLPILGGIAEAELPGKQGMAMAGWTGVASGCLALVGVFAALLYLSQVAPETFNASNLATGTTSSPLQWIWAKL
ncbi:MAG: XrtA system polysaccharide chain length determinant [Geminicoccaceae bacterium]